MNVSAPDLRASLEKETVRSASKVALVALWLVLVATLLTSLPGVDRLIPYTPVTVAAVLGAIVAAVVAGLLVYLAPKVMTLVELALEGPAAVVENLSSAVYWLVVLAAVLVAHRGMAGAITPLMGDLAWLYDVAFLLLGLPAVVFLAVRLYDALDPGSELVAEKVAGSE